MYLENKKIGDIFIGTFFYSIANILFKTML